MGEEEEARSFRVGSYYTMSIQRILGMHAAPRKSKGPSERKVLGG
jgi:hypothetical protein